MYNGHKIEAPMKSVKQMPAGQFKAKCLAVMDEVKNTGEPVVITKRGEAVVKLVPIREKPEDIFDSMKGRAKIVGDIMDSIPLEDWNLD
jgi:prevent-host-death family protein